MDIAWVEAVRLARTNRSRSEELEDRHAALVTRAERESRAQEQQRREVHDEVLVPFRAVFSRLKNVDLAELAGIDLPTAGAAPEIEVTQVRLNALHAIGALAGGLGAGVGAGAGAFVAAGAFGVASTGTAISGLSGAAATSATLAALGGGSLAAGGGGVALGTIVLGGLVAAPALAAAVGVLTWQGRRQRERQRDGGRRLDTAEADLEQAERRTTTVLRRSREVRSLLHELRGEAITSVDELSVLVEHGDDYSTYSPEDRARVASTVSLVTTTITVMGTALVGADGEVTELSGEVTADAHRRLRELREQVSS